MTTDVTPPSVDVTLYLQLVRKVAKQVQRHCPFAEFEDLVSAGYLGLMHAARRYDTSKGQNFASFAEFRIRGAMQDELRSKDFLSRDMRHISKKLVAAEKALQKELGRAPEPAELAARLNVKETSLPKLRAKTKTPVVTSMDDERRRKFDIMDDQASDPFEQLAAKEIVRDLASVLKERHRRVVLMYFIDELPLREIGKSFGVGEAQTSQLLKAALALLRQHYGAPVIQPRAQNRNAA